MEKGKGGISGGKTWGGVALGWVDVPAWLMAVCSDESKNAVV